MTKYLFHYYITPLFGILSLATCNSIYKLANKTIPTNNHDEIRFNYIKSDLSRLCKNGNYREHDGIGFCEFLEGYSGLKFEIDNSNSCKKLVPCIDSGICITANTISDDQYQKGTICSCSVDVKSSNCSYLLCVENPCSNNKCSKQYRCSIQSSSTNGLDEKEQKIVFPIIGAIAFIGVVIIVVFIVRYCRNKSGMEGTYNPNRQEQITGTVETAVPKKPNIERMI